MTTEQRNQRQMGDWQTPIDFAIQCCHLLFEEYKFEPDNVIEPTCGVGNFIAAARSQFPWANVLGIEINDHHFEHLKERFKNDRHVQIIHGDIMQVDTLAQPINDLSTLIIGNAPWESSIQTTANSNQAPAQDNHNEAQGSHAVTADKSFDLTEWLILRAVECLDGGKNMLAMLCKTSVARKLGIELSKRGVRAKCSMLLFNSYDIFKIDAAACLFVCDFRTDSFSFCMGEMDNPKRTTKILMTGGSLHEPKRQEIASLHGLSVFKWRLGIKHDCSKVMELTYDPKIEGFKNKLKKPAVIEPEYIYPYVKSMHIRQPIVRSNETAISLPMIQRKLNEDTAHLEQDAPYFWEYLNRNAKWFDKRKSSIYKKAPRFAQLGVGDYAYAPYKVAISAFYPDPIFALLTGDRPIMCDDTCNFLPFDNETDAKVCMLLLNSEPVINYYKNIALLTSKRPFNQKVLSQLDFAKALEHVGLEGLNQTAERLGIDLRITPEEYQHFANCIASMKR